MHTRSGIIIGAADAAVMAMAVRDTEDWARAATVNAALATAAMGIAALAMAAPTQATTTARHMAATTADTLRFMAATTADMCRPTTRTRTTAADSIAALMALWRRPSPAAPALRQWGM